MYFGYVDNYGGFAELIATPFGRLLTLKMTIALGLLTIFIVSKIDGQLPKNVDQIWMRIHGTASERHEKQHGLDKVGTMFAKGK